MDRQRELRKGVLEGCVLELIRRGVAYGYAITARLQQMGFDGVTEGTVYTILLRLERNALVVVRREPSDKGPDRKLYTLTADGEEGRRAFWDNWHAMCHIVERLGEKE